MRQVVCHRVTRIERFAANTRVARVVRGAAALALTASMLAGCGGGADSPPPSPADPVREWTFSSFQGRNMTVVELDSGRQQGGVFELFNGFGPAASNGSELLDHENRSIDGTIIAQDGIADGQVYSSADGVTYGAFAEAPLGNPSDATSPAGGRSSLRQFQAFVKRSPDATLSFTLTSAFIDLRDDNEGFTATSSNPDCTYPPAQFASLDVCQDIVRGKVALTVKAYTHATGPNSPARLFFLTGGSSEARGHRGAFTHNAQPFGIASTPLWRAAEDFERVPISSNGLVLNAFLVQFKEPRTYTIDLSSLPVGTEFTLSSEVVAEATNRQGNKSLGLRERPSAAAAFLGDPVGQGGTTIEFSGLDPIASPVTTAPPSVPVVPAACPTPDPQAGVIEFSAATYRIDELGSASQPVRVRRTGGSRGAVTATFRTSDGSAVAGVDYVAVANSVFFADGDDAERIVEVPIIVNAVSGEPSRTVNLSLSEAGGCATLGALRAAVLTIDDADLPVVAAFTVGGTVSGLVGSGLLLQDLQRLPLAVGNGPFTFTLPTSSGSSYEVSVLTQPSNPAQVCTVNRGSGIVGNANVTDVAVQCAAPAPTSGLDAAFGGGGKVTTSSTGAATAVALQADGMIVTVGGAFTLTRHRADGSLDTAFGTAGRVSTSFGAGTGSAHEVAIQPDGKIVVAGSMRARAGFSSDDNFALMRYAADGSLDSGFGRGGIVETDFAAGADVATAIAIQADGRIVVAGHAHIGAGSDFALARYNADGSLDTGFGSGGKVTTDIEGGSEGPALLALHADGRILIGGRFGSGGTTGGVALVRYLGDGSLDTGFGSGGKVTVVGSVTGDALALQADGGILVAGSTAAGTSQSAFGAMRFLSDGRVDSVFGTVGTRFFTGGNGSIGRNIALQADGRFVLVGEAASGGSSTFDMAIARFNADGSLDTDFADAGRLVVDFFGNFDGAADVTIQGDGRIVVAGSARNGTPTEFALIRANP